MIGGGYNRPSFADTRLPKHFVGLGVDKIKEYLEKFGLGQKTGIDLPGEVDGRVPDAEWKEEYFANRVNTQRIWYLGDTYNLSIGQGYLLATPIQLASAFSAIANKGILYKPKLVDKVINSEKELIKEEPSEIISNNFIKQENLDIVKQGMRQSVSASNGSAFLLSSLPVEAAAKTGTAQIGSKDVYENWIGVFAPYENPEIVLVVLVEEVPGMQRASLRASKEILDWYFNQKIENVEEEEFNLEFGH
jgi:penicillin-binding protein 2